MAVAVQLLAALFLGAITHSSPIAILQSYIRMASLHAAGSITAFRGIHIGGYLSETISFNILLFLVITVPVGILLMYSLSRQPRLQFSVTALQENRLFELNVLSVLMAWILLAVYHLGYDVVMMIVPFSLIITACFFKNEWGLSNNQSLALAGIGMFVLGLLILPGSIYRTVFQNTIASNIALTLAVILLLGGSTWLMQKMISQSIPASLEVKAA